MWGLLSGSSLVLGTIAGYYFAIPRRIIGAIMAFGSGVLISALSFDLIDEAFELAGIWPTVLGFLGGAALYSGANHLVSRAGAKHRKRSGIQQLHEAGDSGKADNSVSLAMGALLDGIPESVVIGVSLLSGHGVSLVAVAAIFLSNIPEALSSAAGMKRAGRSRHYIFGIWGGIALASGVAALVGYLLFGRLGSIAVAATTAVAAGAVLNMVATTMIPEAFEEEQENTGFITVLGFLTAFCLTKLT